MTDTDTANRLEAILRSFLVSARTQAEDIDDLRANANKTAWAPSEATARLEHLAHKLAGSAGSLGFTALGRDAGALELLLSDARSEGAPWPPDLIAQANMLTHGLVARIRTLRPEDSTLDLDGLSDDAWSPPRRNGGTILCLGLEDEVVEALEAMGLSALPVDGDGDWADRVTVTPGAVVADLGMVRTDPALEGRIRALPRETPVLAVGGSDTFLWRVRASRLGARVYLPHCDAQNILDQLSRMTGAGMAAPPRILILEDDATLARLFTAILAEAGMEADYLTEPDQILDRLIAFEPDVLISDLRMPGYSGAEVAAAVRHGERWNTLPIVFLSREQDLEHQIAALSSGADFFLPKPIQPDLLVSVARDRTTRGRHLRDMTLRDPLTGLYNHTASLEFLEREVARARRGKTALSVALVDIDHFKRVNDTHGHHVGDRVIKTLARLMRGRLRGTDLLGRCGGEEFLIILPGTPPTRAGEVIDGLRAAFAAITVPTEQDPLSLSFSAGTTGFTDGLPPPSPDGEDEPSNARDLFTIADAALYRAKGAGRNRVVVDDRTHSPTP
jgi:diguanylate cyclase (GGDEF)-like protein